MRVATKVRRYSWAGLPHSGTARFLDLILLTRPCRDMILSATQARLSPRRRGTWRGMAPFFPRRPCP